MPDTKLLQKILDHTLKVADKSSGGIRQHMLEQADRIRSQIGVTEPVVSKAPKKSIPKKITKSKKR